jgi:RNA polymerase sigma factor (sigma-70 family)
MATQDGTLSTTDLLWESGLLDFSRGGNQVYPELLVLAPPQLPAAWRRVLDSLVHQALDEYSAGRADAFHQSLRLLMLGFYVGEEDCFNKVSLLTQGRLAAAAYRLLGPVAGREMAAEDITQNALLRAWRSRLIRWVQGHGFLGLSEVSPWDPARGRVWNWLFLLVRSELSGYRRSLARRHEVVGADLPPHDDAGTSVLESVAALPDASPGLYLCLDRLPDDSREAIIDYHWYRMTLEEMAAAAGVSVSTMWKRLQRATKMLRKCLEQEEV